MDELDDRLPLYRRKVFDSDLVRHVAEACAKSPLALVMLDLDKFKAVNDTHGHPVGDELLLEVARCAMDVIGNKGRAYRYGGEEIAILLPNYTEEEALVLAERMRRVLEDSIWTSKQLKITASFGVAVTPSLASDASGLLSLADAALYEAKKLGRNYVRLSGEPLPSKPESRQLERRQPPPGGLSEQQINEFRVQYFKHGVVLCPTDSVPLKVQEAPGMGFKSPKLHMGCPACGFEALIPGIPTSSK